MPRRKSIVKNNRRISPVISSGLVDIHFHGAFGIDLMHASVEQLDDLAIQLWKNGVAAFCPTTLSAPKAELLPALDRLGRWISGAKNKAHQAAPLGIHLEGPFINPKSAGAHPPKALQSLTLDALEECWRVSHKQLKIITLAPELVLLEGLMKIVKWARQNKIVLSLGHSQATEEQARLAFECGMAGVTHAWNALAFHHRSLGPLGAAIGNKNVYIEIIADCVHVAPRLIRWTCELHQSQGKQNPICFVSDCAPSAATRPQTWHSFGPLQAQFTNGASRLPGGSLAGGGLLLTEAFCNWTQQELQDRKISISQARTFLKACLSFVGPFPLKALGISAHLLKNRRLAWSLTPAPGGRFRLTWRHLSG